MSSVSSYRNKQHCRSDKGFTLMEVLIAITIGAMVLGIVASSFSFTVKVWGKASRPPDTMLDDLMDMLSLQMIHLSKTPLMYQGGSGPLFIGRENELIFVTSFSPMGLSKNCPVIAHYRYDRTRKRLTYEQIILANPREIAPRLDEMINAHGQKSQPEHGAALAIPLAAFSILYAPPQETTWRDSWDQPKTFPKKVRIQATAHEESRPVVRVMYTSRQDDGTTTDRRGNTP